MVARNGEIRETNNVVEEEALKDAIRDTRHAWRSKFLASKTYSALMLVANGLAPETEQDIVRVRSIKLQNDYTALLRVAGELRDEEGIECSFHICSSADMSPMTYGKFINSHSAWITLM
jgi:hypothetical protein